MSGDEHICISESLVRAVVPELTLQPPAQFSKTAIAKNMASTIRLTKNLSLARNSPFSLFLATKGSTAWETAIKERKAAIEEDVIPVGWRIVEKQPISDASDASKSAKQSGGIFSFWGRKHSKTPSLGGDSPDLSSPSPARPSSVPPPSVSTTSPRESQDSVVSQGSVKESARPSATPELPGTPSITALASPSATASPSSYADAPDPHADGSQSASPQPPASAVSRFLTRFSRKRSSLSASSPRSSLALSSDDLDVLSDIVPSVQDGDDDEAVKSAQNSFSDILKAEALPPAIPPPPLALAGRLSPPGIHVRTSESELIGVSSGKSQSTASSMKAHDLLDVFGSLEKSTATASSPLSAVSLASASPTALSNVSIILPSLSPIPPFSQASRPLAASLLSDEANLPPKPVTPPSLLTRTGPPSPAMHLGAVSEPSHDSSDTTPGHRHEAHTKALLSISVLPPPSIVQLPPPPSSASSSSSKSEVPLAQLYPNVAVSDRLVNLNTSSSMPRTPSPFALDPPTRSRTHTPIMVHGPSKVAGPPPLLPPPPSFHGHSTVATQSKDLFADEDDEFADFQSSGQAESVTQATAANSSSTSPFPLFQRQQTMAVATSLMFSSIPPPHVKSPAHLASVPPTPQPLSSDPFNDDFASFFSSSSSKSLKPHHSGNSVLDTSFGSDKSLFKTGDANVDFDDFVSSASSSALHTPSPPRPPAKSLKPALSVAVPRISIDPSPKLTREEKKNQHQRTLSLMERAAARPGQWPAPPSPLPQALSFPTSGVTNRKVDLMGEDTDDSFGTFQSDTLDASGSGLSFLSPAPPVLWGAARSASASPPRKPVSPAPTPSFQVERSKTGGGLSAQDLSFFEGL